MEIPRQLTDDFISEAQRVLTDLGKSLDALERGEAPAEQFLVFSQHADGLSQRATLLSQQNDGEMPPAFAAIAKLTENSRLLALKGAALVDPDLVPVVAGCLVDSIDAIGTALNSLAPHAAPTEFPAICATVAERIYEISERIRISPADLDTLKRRAGI